MILYEITVYEMCVKNPLGGTQFSRISAFLGIHHFHRAVVLSVSGTLAALAGETPRLACWQWSFCESM